MVEQIEDNKIFLIVYVIFTSFFTYQHLYRIKSSNKLYKIRQKIQGTFKRQMTSWQRYEMTIYFVLSDRRHFSALTLKYSLNW